MNCIFICKRLALVLLSSWQLTNVAKPQRSFSHENESCSVRRIVLVLAGQFAQADIVNAHRLISGNPNDLVVYIQRDSGKTLVAQTWFLHAHRAARVSLYRRPLPVVNQVKQVSTSTTGIQLLVLAHLNNAKSAMAHRHTALSWEDHSQVQRLAYLLDSRCNTAKSSPPQNRADMKSLQSSAEPRANTLSCASVRAENFSAPEELHTLPRAI